MSCGDPTLEPIRGSPKHGLESSTWHFSMVIETMTKWDGQMLTGVEDVTIYIVIADTQLKYYSSTTGASLQV